ncbi:membrane protein insertase YidC [Flavobacterium gelidilacus]|uniref:membrane protein insertase YidC n=1 Tax=Flavobacterium gelidilacus TaxID=206041 RepID=UPI000405C0CD|nr:membrane protein insertase YidC [Flavobacterium gelidilacus]
MEEKKLDLNSIIGFVLISGILMWMLYTNAPTKEEQETKAKQEQVDKQKESVKTELTPEVTTVVSNDSLQNEQAKDQLGSFAYSSTLPSAKKNITTIENDVLKLEISNKGGYIVNATVKGIEQFERNSKTQVQIIKENNANLNITLNTKDNRVLNTKDMFFEPTLTKDGDNQVLTMRLKAGENKFLEYRYVLKPKEYMLDFGIKTQGLTDVINTSKSLDLEWQLKAFRNEKSISYENRYTEMVYEYEEGKDDYLSAAKDDDDIVKDVSYIAFKQHFFTSILLTDTPFKTAELKSQNLVHDEEIDTLYTKNFVAKVPLDFKNGELNYAMNWYYGPAKYETLTSYEKNLDEIMPLGWGIFGWINRWVFIPVFGFISSIGLGYGLSIIIFTILVRLVMSPITYKSYLSQAKMKVLRPEINELNAKYKDNAMKKQQETMKLYSKAGVNPMAGCLPAVMQIPVFYALFQFFPSMFDLRQKSFLWADDLSSYDAIYQLPFRIPFYGDHVSLFPILASVAIFFYMRMTTGDQQMSAPTQEGMPDMGKIMKIMIYISPVMMLVFFNNYASGLSLYYFISNLITIGIMLVIKKYIVNDEKIHAKIQVNKTKEKKESKFQKKMREMMEQAEEAKAQKKK